MEKSLNFIAQFLLTLLTVTAISSGLEAFAGTKIVRI